MPVIPVLNKDITLLSKDFNDKINQPKHQRNLVLIIVCIALLLDNMLYMVIVPIIPVYLLKIDEQNLIANSIRTTSVTSPVTQRPFTPYLSPNQLVKMNPNLASQPRGPTKATTIQNMRIKTQKSLNTTLKPLTTMPTSTAAIAEEENDDVRVGYLFASKAAVQLLVNPFSGAFIDRIGYDVPMCIGLTIIFFSTMAFSFGNSYWMLFFARSLQGVGSAFADTSGLAMIADRFTEEGERSKALGIALAFISFGSLVAPPFGGFLYQYTDERVPFIALAFLALFDGVMLVLVMRPHRNAMSLQEGQTIKPKSKFFFQN